jgi:P pilus assembly chaperone PapD
MIDEGTMLCRSIAIVATLGALTSRAEAKVAISISNAIVDFTPTAARYSDIIVHNQGDETAYVKVTGEEVLAAGTPEETHRALGPKDVDLLVTPQKMAIPPGGDKQLRLVLRVAERAKERIFRFTIAPVPADSEAPEAGMAVRVVVAYGVLVIVRPEELRPKIEAKRDGKRIEFTNAGNTNVFLETGKQCTGEAASQKCVEVTGTRLYAGQRWSQELPLAGPVEYSLRIADAYQTAVFGQ